MRMHLFHPSFYLIKVFRLHKIHAEVQTQVCVSSIDLRSKEHFELHYEQSQMIHVTHIFIQGPINNSKF